MASRKKSRFFHRAKENPYVAGAFARLAGHFGSSQKVDQAFPQQYSPALRVGRNIESPNLQQSAILFMTQMNGRRGPSDRILNLTAKIHKRTHRRTWDDDVSNDRKIAKTNPLRAGRWHGLDADSATPITIEITKRSQITLENVEVSLLAKPKPTPRRYACAL